MVLLLTLGFWIGLVAFLTIVMLKKIILVVCFPNLEPLTTIDELFLLDWDKNRSNIMTLMKIDRIHDGDAFQQFVERRVT